jgi:hypothetical protein
MTSTVYKIYKDDTFGEPELDWDLDQKVRFFKCILFLECLSRLMIVHQFEFKERRLSNRS